VERIEGPIRQALADAKGGLLQPGDVDRIILIGGQTRMPLVRDFVERIMGKPAERGVDPMEAVAIGAAIEAGVMTGEVKDLLLLDVTPLSLGVETLGGIFTRLIEKNTTIPTKKSQVFSTAADFQTTVTVHVLQGERPMAVDNVSLGKFNLTGIPPAPRGVPQIEVTFDIDTNGILNVTAKDLATGNQQKITITASTKLSESEKERMIKEADQFAEQDKRKREEAETQNNADSIIYTAERTKADLKDKLSKDDVDKIDKGIAELKEALAGKDMAKMKEKTDGMAKLLQQIGAAVYQQASQRQAPPPGTEKKDEKVVDADYKVVDDEKKP
jgi:molecular chaperone DnaK